MLSVRHIVPPLRFARLATRSSALRYKNQTPAIVNTIFKSYNNSVVNRRHFSHNVHNTASSSTEQRFKNIHRWAAVGIAAFATAGIYSYIQAAKTSHIDLASEEAVELFEKNFETLAKEERWKEILAQGTEALQIAKKYHLDQAEAKISAILCSTCFYIGDYSQALEYATICNEKSEHFADKKLFLRSLYLQSATYRALAAKEESEQAQQDTYRKAVEIAERAESNVKTLKINDFNLQAKIYFNLGAAHADNPKGDLNKAIDAYYKAFALFVHDKAIDDQIRTMIRCGKVHLLQKQYRMTQEIIDELKCNNLMSKRLSMHMCYLESQLQLAIHNRNEALKIAQEGLAIAIALEAQEDAQRFEKLLKS